MSGMWPHFDAAAKRCQALYADFKAGHDISKYITTGTEDRRVEIRKGTKRDTSPTKGQTTGSSFKSTGGPSASLPKQGGQINDVMCGPHLKSPEDLTGFPTFPPGTKSLLMKHLSRDLWAKYSNAKDKYGFSFKQAIFSGCKNTDSGIGVYAGSDDSYVQFADFFDLIIEDYHKHGKKDKHNSDMDASKLNCPPFSEEEAKMIKSTRIRVGRNLEGFPLGPGITNQQRVQIESSVVQALKSFTGDLAGTYYPLNNMTEA